MIKWLLIVLLFISSCTEKVGTHIYSYTSSSAFVEAKPKDKLLVMIYPPANAISTNENPNELKLPPIPAGGEDILQIYHRILTEKMGEHVLVLRSGLQGSESLISQGISHFVLPDEKDLLKMSERDLENYEYKKRFVFSNVHDAKLAKPLTGTSEIEWKDFKIKIIHYFNFFSFSDDFNKNNKRFLFDDPGKSFMRDWSEARKSKFDFIILSLNIKHRCTFPTTREAINFAQTTTPLSIDCPKDDILAKFLKFVPPKSVDLIIINGMDKEGRAQYLGNPIVQLPTNGKYALPVILSSEESRSNHVLLPYLKLCHRFFKGTLDCHLERDYLELEAKRLDLIKDSHFSIVPAEFMGKTVQP